MKSVQLLDLAALPPGREAVWPLHPVWKLWKKEKSHAFARNLNRALHPIARLYTNRAIPAPIES
jgi:hypothetical protein